MPAKARLLTPQQRGGSKSANLNDFHGNLRFMRVHRQAEKGRWQ